MGLRALGLALDAQLDRVRIPAVRPAFALGGVAAALAVAVVAFLALGGAHQVSRGYDKFTSESAVEVREAPSQRFTELGNNGRIDHWKVAMRNGYDPHPLRGSGAGTYALLWAQHRKTSFTVVDGHSLEIETLGELGLVGLALLAIALLTMFGALGRRAWLRKGAWAGLTAAGVGWLAQASVDWLWETPAVTLWLFAAGGLALGAPVARRLGVGARAAAVPAAEPASRTAVTTEQPAVPAAAASGGGGGAVAGPVRAGDDPEGPADGTLRPVATETATCAAPTARRRTTRAVARPWRPATRRVTCPRPPSPVPAGPGRGRPPASRWRPRARSSRSRPSSSTAPRRTSTTPSPPSGRATAPR